MSFNFMAAVTICSDFVAPSKLKFLTVPIVSPYICHEVMGLDAIILIVSNVKTTVHLQSFHTLARHAQNSPS